MKPRARAIATAAQALPGRPFRYWGLALLVVTAGSWLTLIGAARLIAHLV